MKLDFEPLILAGSALAILSIIVKTENKQYPAWRLRKVDKGEKF